MTSPEYETELKVYFDGVHYTVSSSIEEHRSARPTTPIECGFERDTVRLVPANRWLDSWCYVGTTNSCEPYHGCEVKMTAQHWVVSRGRGYLFTSGEHL